MYRFFSRLFCSEMDAELWRRIKVLSPDLPLFAEEGSVVPELDAKVRLIAAQGDEEAELGDLANLFARQFLGMSEGHSVALVQSVYTSSKHLMYQDAFFNARDTFLSHSLELDPELGLADDHLAVILGFLGGYLAELAGDMEQATPQSFAGAIENFAEYRDSLLVSWLGALVERSVQLMPGSMYTLFLRYLAEFVEFDRVQGAELLGGP